MGKVNLRWNSTHERSTLNYVKSNSYLNSPSIQNYTTSGHSDITTYESDVTAIDNDWYYFAGKYEE